MGRQELQGRLGPQLQGQLGWLGPLAQQQQGLLGPQHLGQLGWQEMQGLMG